MGQFGENVMHILFLLYVVEILLENDKDSIMPE